MPGRAPPVSFAKLASLAMSAARPCACVLGLAACAAAPPPPPAAATVSPVPPPAPVPPPPPPPEVPANATFRAVASRFLNGYLAQLPQQATQLGEHRFDDRWPDLSADGEAKLRRFLEDARQDLAAVPRDGLDDENQVDARILGTQIDRLLFNMGEIRPAENDPVAYTNTLSDGLDPLVTRAFAPVPVRMTSLRARLLGVPAVVAAARARLKNPPLIYTETAIDQVAGLVALCEHGVDDPLSVVPDQRADVLAAAHTAAASLRELQKFFVEELLPRSNGSFRMGPARFEKILRYELGDDVKPFELVEDARKTMDRAFYEMVETARELWPTLLGGTAPAADTNVQQRALVRRVLAKLGDDATAPRTILADATRDLADATSFVRAHDLVRVPSEPCKVIEMPEYKRGFSIAYCEASGPLEKIQETFYAISPAPRRWSPRRVTSFYREYNQSMLIDLTVHEAMPGHYLQAMHANAFRSEVRTVFTNGAFVEGWAVYGEWLMARYGFGGPKARMQRLKMLLRVCENVLLDYFIHAGTMDEKEALDSMAEQAFQEEGEASGKWNRARLSSGQLSTYFYGYRELMKLRDEAEKTPGFQERSYNERLLSHGAPPIAQLRWLLAR